MTSQTLDVGGTAAVAATDAAAGKAERAPRWVLPVVAGLCVLALALRTAISLHSGMFRDEAQLLFTLDQPSWSAMFDFLRQHDSHPPLLYVVMRVWLSLAGGSDAAALVIPNVLGAALVPALYGVGARLLSWRAGLYAAAAAALSPIVIDMGAMVRPYSLLPLLTLGATYALVRAVDLGGRRRWAAYAALELALVYTHNWGWLVVAGNAAALGLCLWRGVARPRAAVLRGWVAAQAAVAIGFLPWLPSLLQQTAHAGYPSGGLGIDGLGSLLFLPVGLGSLLARSTLTRPGAAAVPSVAVFSTLIVGMLALGLRSRRRSAVPRPPASAARTVLVVTPFAAMGAALVLSVRTDLLMPHCIVTLAPLMLLLVAAALDRWWAVPGLAWFGGIAAVALVAGYAAMLPALYQEPRSNARDVAGQVASEAAGTDMLVIGQWWLASSFNRYYAPSTEQIDFPAMTRVGTVLYDDTARRIADPAAFVEAEHRLAAGRAAGRRVWLITEGELLDCPDAACEAKTLSSRDFTTVAAFRTGQLSAFVTRLYGPPVHCLTGTKGAGRFESLKACLYAPS